VPRTLVVEFVGLPGVGKSTATQLVANGLAAAGTPVRSASLRVNLELPGWRRVVSKSSIGAAEALGRPRHALRVGRMLVGSGQRRRRDVARLWYNWLFLAGLLRRARTRPVVELLDEGIFQLLWSIGLNGGRRALRECSSTILSGAATAAALPDVVVVVEAPLEVVQARLTSRGSRAGRVDRMTEDERRAALIRGEDLLAEVLSEEVRLIDGASSPRLRRVRNASSEELATDVDALVAELASLAA
jgi:broad-specificity NMP kinase